MIVVEEQNDDLDERKVSLTCGDIVAFTKTSDEIVAFVKGNEIFGHQNSLLLKNYCNLIDAGQMTSKYVRSCTHHL